MSTAIQQLSTPLARHSAAGASFPARHNELARSVQSADSRSKRSPRSIEDFTEFEQRTAYFKDDPIRALKKGANILDRVRVSHMAQAHEHVRFPLPLKLDPVTGRDCTDRERQRLNPGEDLFFGKLNARVATLRLLTSTTRCTISICGS
jgi:hypothetical protein